MKIGVPREIAADEQRVALVPAVAAKLIASGLEVLVESSAGLNASFNDQSYESAGVEVVSGPIELFSQADVVLKVRPPQLNDSLGNHEISMMRQGSTLISFLEAWSNREIINMLASHRITALAMESIPRISRAQAMDALTSQSSIAGYRAVTIAAFALGKLFPMMITAAGTIPPAKGLIIGAGVAGLQAIATARRLGAVVSAFDIRPTAQEEVQSLGATFLDLALAATDTEGTDGYAKPQSEEMYLVERNLISEHIHQVDFIICTALVPGKVAPVLVTDEMVQTMKPGSVIVDLAAPAGGNCALTEPGATVTKHNVTIYGPNNLPSSMPIHSSELYARNCSSLLTHLIKNNQLELDFEDTITRSCCITHDGVILDKT